MVGQISAALAIDKSRIYAAGMSNGGIMSYALACNSDIFAAIGPDSATQLDACAAPHPTSVIHIHGTADRLVPYDGGKGTSFVNGPPIADVNAFWRNVDHCGAPDIATNAPVTTSTAACADNRSVVLITIDGGRHGWPGGTTAPRASGPNVARAERHRDHLAVLRGPPCLSTRTSPTDCERRVSRSWNR